LIHLSCNKKRTVDDKSVYSQVQKQIQEVEKDAVKTMKPHPSMRSIMAWMAAFLALSFANSSFHASSTSLSLTFAFPLPFDFDRDGPASLAFGVALVVLRKASRPRNVDASGVGTVNCAGHRPMYSAALYQLKK
jgi:hypothetical protein